MSSGAEEDLLRMSLTGALSGEAQASFEAEKDAGNKAFREGLYRDAIHHYTAAERINPLSPVPPANRAMAYLKLSKYQQAKADASVALELYNALPCHMQPPSLPVKILLRRATANFELLLYALAAEDFAAVLKRDPNNEPAKAQLTLLQENFSIVPGRTITASTESNTKVASGRIELLSESTFASSPERKRKALAPTGNGNIQNETVLVELPRNVMDTLVSKWSAVPPQSAFEFERAWKSLQGNKTACAKYLILTVGPVRLANGLLGESLTPQLLEELVLVLKVALENITFDSTAIADILLALTRVSRFDMLLMFLSPEEKRPLSFLLQALQKKGVPAEKMSTLKESYT